MHEQPDDAFYDLADQVIGLANESCDSLGAGKASAAVLYGAARFNAFIVASMPGSDIPREKEAALDYFTEQYRKMLAEHLDDFHAEGAHASDPE